MTISPARKLAIAQRRQQVARLYLQGQGQTEIALELEMSQSTVSKDLHHIHTAWRESAIRDFDALRDLEIARLNHIEREAWAAWERSQRPPRRRRRRRQNRRPPDVAGRRGWHSQLLGQIPPNIPPMIFLTTLIRGKFTGE